MKEDDEGARLGGRIGFSGSAVTSWVRKYHLTRATHHLTGVSRSSYSSGHPPRATQTCLPSCVSVSLVIKGCGGTSG